MCRQAGSSLQLAKKETARHAKIYRLIALRVIYITIFQKATVLSRLVAVQEKNAVQAFSVQKD